MTTLPEKAAVLALALYYISHTDSETTKDTHDLYFTGPEAEQLALQLMTVDHKFRHPALQEWYLDKVYR